MSDIACHCGKRGALFAKDDHNLFRYHLCREHLDPVRVANAGLSESQFPPSMPAIFRDTDIERLHDKIKDNIDWRPEGDKTGLLIHGTTGVGKTRALWEIVRRMWVQKTRQDVNMPYLFLTMRKIESMIEQGFDTKKHGTMLESLIEHPLLVIDDLGKERLTSRMASDLFAIVDERSVNRKTTIISTNFNGTTLLERFENKDKETGVALIRRLKDYYTIVGCS
jgi:DNA replication protein DnaC